MIRLLLITLVCCAAGAPAAASLWDRDAIALEKAGVPDTRAVLARRYPQYPAEYYEARLKRCSEAINLDRKAIDEYDDAACACFRLGRVDEAIEWMRRKEAAMPAAFTTIDSTRVRNQTYRMHCNLATFLSHRWARAGFDRAKMADLVAARDALQAAFTKYNDLAAMRDRYQYALLNAVIKGNAAGALARTLPDMFGLYPRSIFAMQAQELAEAGVAPQEAIDALRALICVGGEDQGVDYIFALGLVLGADGRSDDSCLALWRATELADSGGVAWMLPVVRASALKAVIKASAPPMFGDNQSRHAIELEKLATEARAWNGARNTYLLTAMRDGRHPDTDPDFWTNYDTPKVIAQTEPRTGFGSGVLAPAAAIGLLVIAGLGFAIYFMIKRHKAIPTVKDL